MVFETEKCRFDFCNIFKIEMIRIIKFIKGFLENLRKVRCKKFDIERIGRFWRFQRLWSYK